MTYQIEVSESDLPSIKLMIDNGEYQAAGEALRVYMLDNDDLSAAFLLGRLLLEMDQPGIARIVYEWILEKDKRWQNWLNLGKSFDHLNKPEDAERCLREALRQDPNNALLQNSLGSNLVNQYKSEETLKLSNKTLKTYPNDGRSLSNRGFANLQLRNYGQAWDDYEHGIGQLSNRIKKIYQDEPYWDGAKGQSLYIYGEQGLGDQIAGCEPLRDLQKDCDVKVLDCGPKLKNLLQRSFPKVEVHGDLFKQSVDWHNDYKIDASCSIFSVHRHYRRSEEDYPKTPYLIADPDRRIQWRALLDSLGNKPKVGIAWTGGVSLTNRAARTCSLDTLLPVLSQDCTFINLEYRDREKDIKEFEERQGIKIHSWPWALQSNDYDDTAALVSELDLIITVPTSIVHLAGALGVKTFCMVHKRPNIHYARDGETMPYYDCIKLLRHPDNLEIGANMAADELKEYLNGDIDLRRIA